MENEAAAFERGLSKRNAADAKWLAQVRQSGTTQDKVAAFTLVIQVRVNWGAGQGNSLAWVQKRVSHWVSVAELERASG